ncbi:MAG TPA: protease pro-enzyme activation domain-containing protein [Candidatus Acidoferrum sp.]|nr:protease pro-enzyme activation domain-containing protein [Candidatus Acidoferrum sp.]
MFRKTGFLAVVILAALVAASSAFAQAESRVHARSQTTPSQVTQARIKQSIDETNRVALRGNTRPEAVLANDRGPVANDFLIEHMLLQLKRSPEQEKALQQFLDELQTAGSPNFHHWLTAQEFGERFGVAKSDLDAIASWLESHGFRVNVVYPSGMLIDFSGTAAQVHKAFQTEIHHLLVKGEKHVGNISDPQIPAALAPVVAGIVSLHDFKPYAMHNMHQPRPQFTFQDQFGFDTYAIVPADLATIYNLNPLFNAGISGQGQTIVLIEDTDVFTAVDWSTFRSTFGLSSYTSASFTQLHPPAPPLQPGNNCGAPGVISPNDAEAILDAEWASASAPSAAIEMAACADTTTTFGGLIALQNLINASSAPPSIMSISYGQCETVNGAAANASYNSAYQQAVAEGVSVFVAAGDSGAAGCDNSVAVATQGIAVNAFASTPNNVAVGGTDFSDTYSGTNARYWNSSNTSVFGSALSYIPEIPWNDSCAGQLVSAYEGYTLTYGSSSFCNDPTIGSLLQTTVAGGGGPSQCATGTPSINGVVSGSCAGWPKPSWQSVLGNPNDGVRDTPDVSLFAADGLWSHFYVFCWSDTKNGGAVCGSDPSAWSGAGGTSFASPIMAGIQALINQKAGGPQGNPAPVYYQLAAAEYGSAGSNSCNSNNGNAAGASCVFYDVTMGDMDVDCTGPNCFLSDGSVGVLSTSNTSFAPAYGTTTGWDFATGIGTVNAANLANNWPSSTTQPSFLLSASPAGVAILQGASGSTTISINPLNGFSGSVNLAASGLPSGVSGTFGTNPTTASSLLTLSAAGTATTGAFTVTVTGTSGSLTSTTTFSLIVNPQGSFTLSASPASLTVVQGANGTSTITINALSGFNSSVNLSVSGLPSGVTASFNPTSTTGASTLTLTAGGASTTGPATVTITGTAGNLTSSTTLSLTVNPPPNFTLSASPSSLTIMQGSSGASAITVNPLNGFSGSVALSASGLPNGVTPVFNPTSTAGTSTLTLTASSTAATGTVTVTVTGTSGLLTKTTTISLMIRVLPTLPAVWSDGDIGSVGVTGATSYANGVFTVSGAGSGTMITSTDSFHFVYQPFTGDGSIVARVLSVQGSSATQAGIMIRETLANGANHVFLFDYSTSILATERTTTGASSSYQSVGSATLPNWIKLTRSGNAFNMYGSADGVNWVPLGTSQTVTMAASVYLGLAVSNRNTASLATASFDSVSVNSAAAPAPLITAVSATTGSIGSQVVISGSGFGATQGGSAVLLNGAAVTINSWSDTSITITIPSGATTGPMLVSVAPSMNDSNPARFTVTSQPLPASWLDQDVGVVGVLGSAGYANGVFTVAGAGNGTVITSADSFHFVFQPLAGDGTIVARVVSVQGSSAAQVGVMIRETLGAGANHLYLFDYSPSLLLTERTTTGSSSAYQSVGSATPPNWLKLIRSGNVFTMYSSTNGTNWTQLGASQTVTMAQNVYMGLAVSNRNTSSLASATFDNVTVTTPAPPSPNFSLSTSLSSMTMTQGASATNTITITPQFGFSGNVGLSASGLPAGVTASFNPSTTATTSTLTLTAVGTASVGTFPVTITGASGSLTNTVTISLILNPQGSFTISAAPTGLTVPQGSSGTSTVTVALQGGFNGTISLSASGLPNGVTALFNPSSTTTTSSLTLTASATAATGTVAVTVTGSSLGLTSTVTINLTVSQVILPLPSVWSDGDIGSVGVAGSASYSNGTFAVSGAGSGTMITSADSFHFVYQTLNGDGTVVARVLSVQGSSAAQAGIMIRETLASGANHAFLFDYASSILATERTTTGSGSSYQSVGSATLPYWIKLTRSGNLFTMFGSADGVNWVQLGTNQTVTMASSVYVGLAVSNRTTASTATATFDSVSLSSAQSPAPVISAVSATTGAIGSQIVISGTGFGATQSGSAVLLNGAAMTINSWSATSITVTIPAGATTGPLLVSVAPTMNDSNPVRFAVTSQPLPISWLDQDVGAVGVFGSAGYSNGAFTVAGAGNGTMITASDSFHFVYQPLTGDCTIIARVVSVQGSSAAQIGIMVRETLDPGANHVFVFDYPPSVLMTDRTSPGTSSSYQWVGSATPPNWLKLVRSGNVFSMYGSTNGTTWAQLGTSQTVIMAPNIYGGLAVSNRMTASLATATFDNVSLTTP